MKVLFIGGTGTISYASSQLALERGFELTLLNRGTSARPVPQGARVIHADIRDESAVAAALSGQHFDAVVAFVGFLPEHASTDIRLFSGMTDQYVFISSASAYQTPPQRLPVTEETPLSNPAWQYSRDKIACEEVLMKAYREQGFPVTIVRPSHTYDQPYLPIHGGWTVIDRMQRGIPVIVHGDGTSLWTLTHATDIAKGLVGLLGQPDAVGEAFNITSDEWLTWNQIYEITAAAFGLEAELVHVPSDLIAAYDPEWGDSLLGDKAHSFILDNSKIKRFVPDFVCTTSFAQGVLGVRDWYLAEAARQHVSSGFNAICERIFWAYARAWPTNM